MKAMRYFIQQSSLVLIQRRQTIGFQTMIIKYYIQSTCTRQSH